MKTHFLIATLLLSLCLSACKKQEAQGQFFDLVKAPRHAQTVIDLASHSQKIVNIYYTERQPRSVTQTMDLYLPVETAVKRPYPVVIWIHGGSWFHGDKNEECLPCRLLARRYAVASINYRLTSEKGFPAQINDAKAAVRYLRANAERYHLDPSRIAVWGTSAGGYLAALLGTSGDVEALDGDDGYAGESSRVQAVVDFCGPTNLNSIQSQAGPRNKIRFDRPGTAVWSLMGGNLDKKRLAEASPITYVSKDDPPFLIMHGDIDDAIPPAQGEELHKALQSAGVKSSFHLLKGAGHGFSAPEQLDEVEDFLSGVFQNSKPAR